MWLKEVLTKKKGDLILLIKILQNGTKGQQYITYNIHVYHNQILIHNSYTYLIHNYMCAFST